MLNDKKALSLVVESVEICLVHYALGLLCIVTSNDTNISLGDDISCQLFVQ